MTTTTANTTTEESTEIVPAQVKEAAVTADLTSEGLIIVSQLPVIIENLALVKPEIERRVDRAVELAKDCTPDNYKSIKKMLTEINSLYNEFENRRKTVKREITKPYTEFETVYKNCVSVPFERGQRIIKQKYEYATEQIIANKRRKVQQYFDEYAESLGIDFITLDRLGLKVNLSVTEKALKTQIKDFLDGVKNDVDAVEAQSQPEDVDEIMMEYKKSLDLNAAFGTVLRRREALKREREKAEERRKRDEKKAAAIAQCKAIIAEAVEQEMPVDAAKPADTAEEPAQTEANADERLNVLPREPRSYTVKFEAEATSLEALSGLKKVMMDYAAENGITIRKA